MALERQAEPPTETRWIRSHAAGLACCAIGIAAIGIIALVTFGGDGELTEIPSPRLTVPFLVAALITGIASFVRKERAYVLPLSGVGLSVAAMVLGWALVVGVVVAVTALAIVVLSELL
jgi:hypothetical protein